MVLMHRTSQPTTYQIVIHLTIILRCLLDRVASQFYPLYRCTLSLSILPNVNQVSFNAPFASICRPRFSSPPYANTFASLQISNSDHTSGLCTSFKLMNVMKAKFVQDQPNKIIECYKTKRILFLFHIGFVAEDCS